MLSTDQIQAIVTEMEGLGISEQSVQTLRAAHPDVHFTYCMDDDVGAMEPYLEAKGFNVYLVDGRDHCMKFTKSLETATGLVLAEVIADVD
jgi:hypothetical protein